MSIPETVVIKELIQKDIEILLNTHTHINVILAYRVPVIRRMIKMLDIPAL